MCSGVLDKGDGVIGGDEKQKKLVHEGSGNMVVSSTPCETRPISVHPNFLSGWLVTIE